VRTGTHSYHNSVIHYAGETDFSGKIVGGIGNDISVNQFTDQDVVIVGLGAFGVENIRRALQGRAKSITVLSRRFDKLLFPECAAYFLRYRLQQENAFDQDQLDFTWNQAYECVHTISSLTNTSHIVLNPNCVREIDGSKHFVFTNGFPSMASNTVYLAHYYGLVKIYEDEISAFYDGHWIRTKHGREIHADIVVKSMGFATDESLLRDHVLVDSYFIDGCSTMTHNVRGDRINGSKIIGSRARIANFLISYYEDPQEFDRCNFRLNLEPQSFQELTTLPPDKNYSLINQVDYFALLELSAKLTRSNDPEIRQILARNRATRREMYQELLPPSKFLTSDKQNWHKLSSYFASITNIPVLPYPFNESLFE
jgi:hypothetical protein